MTRPGSQPEHSYQQKSSMNPSPVLHALIDAKSPYIALMAEGDHQDQGPKRGRKPLASTLSQYPNALSASDLLSIFSRMGIGDQDTIKTARWVVHLPTIDGVPVSSFKRAESPDPPRDAPLIPFYVPVILCPYEIWMDLAGRQEDLCTELILGWSVRYLFHLAHAAHTLVLHGRYRPEIHKAGGRYQATWTPGLAPDETEWVRQMADLLPPVSRFCMSRASKRESVPDAHARVYAALSSMMQVVIYQGIAENPPIIRPGKKMREFERDGLSVMADLTGRDLHVDDHVMPRETARSLQKWLDFSNTGSESTRFHPCLLLREPPPEQDEPWDLSLYLRSEADPSLILPAEVIWSLTDAPGSVLPPARFMKETLLTGLGMAAAVSPVISSHLTGETPAAASLSLTEVSEFLTHDAPEIKEKGVELLLPAWWREDRRVTPRLEISASRTSQPCGTGFLGISEILSFDYRIALGDEVLTPHEFWEAVRLKKPFVRVRGRWISCDAQTISHAVKNFEKRYIKQRPSAGDLIRLSLNVESDDALMVSVSSGDTWTGDLLSMIRDGGAAPAHPIPDTFTGTLRPYQEEGVTFLLRCSERGFGACLADDMGLGKTPQTIAWLLQLRAAEPELAPSLLICPMSVVGNWERELRTFAPSLRVWIHHGTNRCKGDEFEDLVRSYDLILTTYHLTARDLTHLSQVRWSAVILDEAQNIKNPDTNQAKAVLELQTDRRVALTGTPVENRLSELWSIMNFLNPGYLSTEHSFRQRYVALVEQERDPAATAELRRLIRPFILRRMKTDTSIIADLPEKMESRMYCSLTREQATLYQAVVQEMAQTLDNVTGIARRGAILAAITRLKQVCNHPGILAGDNSMIPSRSGKVSRVCEMLEEICEEGESSLIFSQYATFARDLASMLRESFSCPVLLLTGSTPRAEREKLIREFQTEGEGPAIFVISLKAGGTGLNLTAATHVFHIDRWWNPAVEDQATDRTYRIGQKRNVQVHLMIAAGTLEERIDEMNQKKRTIATDVLAGGDDYLTSMTTGELLEIVSLRDTVFTDGEE